MYHGVVSIQLGVQLFCSKLGFVSACPSSTSGASAATATTLPPFAPVTPFTPVVPVTPVVSVVPLKLGLTEPAPVESSERQKEQKSL